MRRRAPRVLVDSVGSGRVVVSGGIGRIWLIPESTLSRSDAGGSTASVSAISAPVSRNDATSARHSAHTARCSSNSVRSWSSRASTA